MKTVVRTILYMNLFYTTYLYTNMKLILASARQDGNDYI